MNDNLREQRIRALHEHIDGLEDELATARAVRRKIVSQGDISGDYLTLPDGIALSDAERAWLASISPPGSGDDS